MATKIYKLHTDPGHGWLAVRRSELRELNIADKISAYSYEKGQMVYLEEDCDLSIFIGAYRAKHGADPVWKTSYRDKTFVRNCSNYQPQVTPCVAEVVVPVSAKAIAKLVPKASVNFIAFYPDSS